MLKPASSGAFTCLSCQLRLGARRLQRQPQQGLVRPPTGIRSQSTAAVQIDDYDEPGEHIESNDHDQLDSGHRPPLPSETTHSRSRRSRLSRIWTPSPVADLGLTSLGMPAEVLVLEPRDRIIPRVPTLDDKQHESQVSEALQAERAPLNPEQVRQNIEQFKPRLDSGADTLEIARRNAVIENLKNGFTKTQLLRYILDVEKAATAITEQQMVKDGPETSIVNPDSAPRRKRKTERDDWSKQTIARHILETIWGFPSTQVSEPQDSQQPTATSVHMAASHLRALLPSSSQPLKQISESFKVVIDVFGSKQELLIRGSESAVKGARKAAIKLRKIVRHLEVPVSNAQKTSNQGASTGHLLSKIMDEVAKRHRVDVRLSNTKTRDLRPVLIGYIANEHAQADLARRDVLLGATERRSTVQISTTTPMGQPSSWLAPFGSSDMLPWWKRLQNFSYGRLEYFENAGASSSAVPRPAGHLGAQGLEDIKRHLSTPVSGWDGSRSALQPTESTHVALGQALFRTKHHQRLRKHLTNAKNNDPPTDNPQFLVDIPFLTQFLASSTKPIRTKPQDKLAPKRTYIHRLHLLPVPEGSPLPTLEVVMSGEDEALGLRQPLHIKSFSALLDGRTSLLLLPNSIVDAQVVKKFKYDFYRKGASPHKRQVAAQHGRINQELLAYLNLGMNEEQPQFAPFFKFTIPNTLALRLEPASPVASPSEEADKPGKDQPKGNVKGKGEAAKRKKVCMDQTEYMLASSETFDMASFEPEHPDLQGFRIDHVQFSDSVGDTERQELRLIAPPSFGNLGEGLDTVRTLISAACTLAEELGTAAKQEKF